jgi:hypothetical protein
LPPAKALLKTDSMAPISGTLPGSEARRAVEGSSFRTRNAEGMLGAVWPPITLYRPFSMREFPGRRWSDEGPESIKTLGRLDGDLRFHMHQYHSPSGQKNDSSLWDLRLAAGCPPLQKHTGLPLSIPISWGIQGVKNLLTTRTPRKVKLELET